MKLNKESNPKMKKSKLKIAIVLPYFNDTLGLELYKNTKDELLKNGIPEKNIELFRVPGALELPLAAKKILQKKFDICVALGIIIQGETYHFELVCNNTYQGLMNIALELEKPIIFGVLTVKNRKQAEERILKECMNKGAEFAQSALEMATLINSF